MHVWFKFEFDVGVLIKTEKINNKIRQKEVKTFIPYSQKDIIFWNENILKNYEENINEYFKNNNLMITFKHYRIKTNYKKHIVYCKIIFVNKVEYALFQLKY